MRGKGKQAVVGQAAHRRPLAVLLVGIGLILPAQASGFTRTQLDSTAVANRAVGKLYLDFPVGTVKCSAAVVDAPNRSTILTAGHCLNSVADGGSISGARFYPGYHDGTAPFGKWESVQAVPSPQWGGTNYSYDYGFIVVGRDAAGKPIEDVVGGLPMAFNQPRSQTYRPMGYPRLPNPPYDGEHLWACNTAWAADFYASSMGPPQMSVGCDFGHGASGGPWLTAQGAVASLNSNSQIGVADIEDGPYFDGDAASLLAAAGSISTAPPTPAPAVPAAVGKKCKHKGHSRAIAAKKKKCKKKHHH
jgi:V8-like Glu-specific endopeptidase